jgi:hypothetical protein
VTPLWWFDRRFGRAAAPIAIGPEVDDRGARFIETQHAYQIAQRPNLTFKLDQERWVSRYLT